MPAGCNNYCCNKADLKKIEVGRRVVGGRVAWGDVEWRGVAWSGAEGARGWIFGRHCRCMFDACRGGTTHLN